MIIYPEAPQSSSQHSDSSDKTERFPNLRSAGRDLALRLERFRHEENLIVLAIALGGIPVAHEVAEYLEAPLEFIIIRRLLTPQGPGSQVCAVNVAGQMVLPDELLPLPNAPSSPLDYFVADALAQLQHRAEICRRGRPPIDVADKTVLLVDCGARTGMTMQAAIDALRVRRPRRIIAALPIASLDSRAALATITDELVCPATPEPFGHVGLWYSDFRRPGDEVVGELLEAGPSVR
jgi:putative phosphoribosyl transferase